MVEKDPTQGIELQETQPNEFLNGDVGFTLVNLNFGKQILVSLALLCASALIYLVVLFLCVQGHEIYYITPTEAPHQVVFVLESKEGRNSDIGQVLHRTGLTGLHNRSNRLSILFQRLSLRPV